jgi:hypothetical protein
VGLVGVASDRLEPFRTRHRTPSNWRLANQEAGEEGPETIGGSGLASEAWGRGLEAVGNETTPVVSCREIVQCDPLRKLCDFGQRNGPRT